MRRWCWMVVSIVGFAAVAVIGAQQQERAFVAVAAVVERVQVGKQEGKVDWTYAYVQASGESVYPAGRRRAQARLLARRGAIMDGQRNLLEIVAGVRVSAESVMKDFEVASDIIRTRVEGIVKGAVVVEEKDLGDSYRVTMRIPMSGELAALINETMKQPELVDRQLTREQVERFSPPEIPEERRFVPPTPPELTPLPLPEVEEGPFTGLIIDCRGLGVRPSMCPKIRDANGREVWGTVKVSREFVIKHGVVGYLRDIRQLNHPDVVSRIGVRPLVIRAIGVGGMHRTDPMVTEGDAERILEENGRYHFLDEMRVIFFIGER